MGINYFTILTYSGHHEKVASIHCINFCVYQNVFDKWFRISTSNNIINSWNKYVNLKRKPTYVSKPLHYKMFPVGFVVYIWICVITYQNNWGVGKSSDANNKHDQNRQYKIREESM